MRQQVFFLIITTVLLASCQHEREWEGAPEIKAKVESEKETRTSLSVDESGAGTIYWNPSDKIDVFFGTKKVHYTSQNTSDATIATFKTSESVSGSDVSSTNIWGLYPSSSSSSCNGSSITTTLPSTQYGVPNTFDKDIFPAMAHSSSTDLQFYNVCGGIKFNLAYDDIKKITFRGNNNEDLAGTVSISFEDNLPKATIVNGVKEITLTPKTGMTFTKGADYYFILLPGILSAGFTITFTATDGTTGTLNYTDKPVTIKRSIFGKKGNMDVYAAFSDDRQPNNVIYYTSTDGQIVVPHATDVFGADIVSNEFVDGRGVIVFDNEVTSIGKEAFDCYGNPDLLLSSISIPYSVTSIGNDAFKACRYLESVNIPDNVISIGTSAFYETRLSSITIPRSVTSIGIGPFNGCRYLESIKVSSDNQYYDSRNNCNAIIQTASNRLVSGCKSTVIPQSVTIIGRDAFAFCYSLFSITFPSSVTTIEYGAFWACDHLTSIVLPSSITKIEYGAFAHCHSLNSITVNALSPPIGGVDMFKYTNSCPIYVPAQSVDTYKTAAGWSVYADRIQAIPGSYYAVDLGLSVRWASCNLGAISEEDYGDYYAWGETKPKSGYYDWASYRLCGGSYNTLTKYNLVESAGTVDNKTILEPSDDAAYVNWGAGWRMPTKSEMLELGQKCTWTWTTQGGIPGYRVTSKINGNNVFLPASGVRNDLTPYDLGTVGSYWSISSCLDLTGYAYRLEFESDGQGWGGFYRSYGMAVRPVHGSFVPVESVSLDKTSIELQVGGTSVLTASVSPSGASEKTVTWFSDNTSVAKVSSYGMVTAVSPGTATITAYTNDGLKTALCAVTVVAQKVTSIVLNKTSVSLNVGDTYQLTAQVLPSNATNKQIEWTSSDSSIATVSSLGLVSARKGGTAFIVANAMDGSGTIASCEVVVMQHASGITLSQSELSILVGEQQQIIANIIPVDATDKGVTWSSSNGAIASVNSAGVITGLAQGTSMITATATDGGVSASCNVSVTLSTVPAFNTLSVVFNSNAKRYYITTQQYEFLNMNEYAVEGLCLESFIIDLYDKGATIPGSDVTFVYEDALDAPTSNQATIIVDNITSINAALVDFGGVAFRMDGSTYWTSTYVPQHVYFPPGGTGRIIPDAYYYFKPSSKSVSSERNGDTKRRVRRVLKTL